MFSRLRSIFSPTPPPIATIPDTVQRRDQTFHKPTAQVYSLRRGMWVVVPDLGVGILTNVYEGGRAQVMLTDEAGHDRLAVPCGIEGLRKARMNEIPHSRRPDASRARFFGYN